VPHFDQSRMVIAVHKIALLDSLISSQPLPVLLSHEIKGRTPAARYWEIDSLSWHYESNYVRELKFFFDTLSSLWWDTKTPELSTEHVAFYGAIRLGEHDTELFGDPYGYGLAVSRSFILPEFDFKEVPCVITPQKHQIPTLSPC
jgi:hypothetical protein